MQNIIPFNKLKEDKSLIKSISLDNIDVLNLLNTCLTIDMKISSLECDILPHISFILDENSKHILYKLCEKILDNEIYKDIISISIGMFNNENICMINYYGTNYIKFFDMLDIYIKKIIYDYKNACNLAYRNQLDTCKEISELISRLTKHETLITISKNSNGELEYILTIHNNNYQNIYRFEKDNLKDILLLFKNRIVDDYYICYSISSTDILNSNYHKLVRNR